MTGRNPWAVLRVAEDAPYTEVQRAFRRRVKQTHPDRGGQAAEFAVVIDAFARLRHDIGPSPRPTPRGPSPYDRWIEPSRPRRSWSDTLRPFATGSQWAGPVRTPPGVTAETGFTTVLAAEMARTQGTAAPAFV
ncbi:MAG TPA: J domain-containing protein [Acidimicrobiales bacterium]|nr:J domain-containing protein [Acidimicrobiales bacterium]